MPASKPWVKFYFYTQSRKLKPNSTLEFFNLEPEPTLTSKNVSSANPFDGFGFSNSQGCRSGSMTFECESSFLNSNKMQIRMQYKEETVLLSALLEKNRRKLKCPWQCVDGGWKWNLNIHISLTNQWYTGMTFTPPHQQIFFSISVQYWPEGVVSRRCWSRSGWRAGPRWRPGWPAAREAARASAGRSGWSSWCGAGSRCQRIWPCSGSSRCRGHRSCSVCAGHSDPATGTVQPCNKNE